MEILSKEWDGPKIIKQGNQYLAMYQIISTSASEQIALSQILDDYLDVSLKKTHLSDQNKTIYHYFRTTKDIDDPTTNDHSNDRSNDRQNDRPTTDQTKFTIQDYLDHINLIQPPITFDNASPIIKQRLEREKQWKDWFQEYQKEQIQHQNDVVKFLHQAGQHPLNQTKNLLLEFQVEHVKILLQAITEKNRILDASDTGTGKTYAALAVAKELNLYPIVICPKSIRPAWERVIDIFFPDHKSKKLEDKPTYVNNYERFRNGGTPYATKKQAIAGHNHKNPKLEFEWTVDPKTHLLIFDECHKTKNTSTQNYALYWWAHQNPDLKIISLSATVADKIENAYSITYQLGIVNTPNQFQQKYLQPLDETIIRYFGYEVTRDQQFRLNQKYKNERNNINDPFYHLKLLHHHFFPLYGSRMIITELGTAFPENLVLAQIYDMDDANTQKIQETYQQLQDQLAYSKLQTLYRHQEELQAFRDAKIKDDKPRRFKELEWSENKELILINQLEQELESRKSVTKKRNKKSTIPELDPSTDPTTDSTTDQTINSSTTDPTITDPTTDPTTEPTVELAELIKFEKPEELPQGKLDHLTAIMRARQQIELFKADAYAQLAMDFLEKDDQSVVIFVNFVKTLDHLMNVFRENKIKFSTVHGGQTGNNRQEQIDQFQNNKTRLILMTMGSGKESISLHDQQGGHPRISIISPTWSAQDLIQALGRIHRAEGKTPCRQYIVYSANTIEERICQAVSKKIETINTINDGDLTNGINLHIN